MSSNGFEVSPEDGKSAGGEVGSRADAAALATGKPVQSLDPEVLYNYEVGSWPLVWATRRH